MWSRVVILLGFLLCSDCSIKTSMFLAYKVQTLFVKMQLNTHCIKIKICTLGEWLVIRMGKQISVPIQYRSDYDYTK